MFLIYILFSCAPESIVNLRDARPARVNFAIYSYLIVAYRKYSPFYMIQYDIESISSISIIEI